jgi:peptidoglycan/xylan/chitin deacetylase (PgdA/CDA1 family)
MLFRAFCLLQPIILLNLLWGSRTADAAISAQFALWVILTARGVSSMRSQIFGKVLYKGDPAANSVALTFDDGPSVPYTSRTLDILKEHGVKATFFVIGKNVAAHPEIAGRMHDEGHEFGNHTYSHPWMFRIIFSAIRKDIELCQTEISRITGSRPRFFRQPIGMNNPGAMKVLDGLGMVMVGWQTRAYDGVDARTDAIVRRVLEGVRPGGIILLHDGVDEKLGLDRSCTVDALKEIIPALKARGYNFKTVSELTGIVNIQPVPV